MAGWNHAANELFLRAAEIEVPDQRREFIATACNGDSGLRREVESLLAASEQSGNFLNRPLAPVAGLMSTADYRPLPEGPGAVIGPYKLQQQIGEGGFGVVFMAEQEQPLRRRVALKIIKVGMDTREVIARFEAERQALALMDHPNIAKVFDAGSTPSGRPYFVMELVKGLPITEFCDKNHMRIEQRLNLFLDVCRAIQHAHHKGIIHRDIKPTNVMVTLHDGVPVVKVIDFGVAKATVQRLTEKTLFTGFGQMVGTPAYMSPEQAEMSGLDIDTRSDVYSLGVLLYELLTGTTPLELKRLREAGYAEMQRLIREEEPPRPSLRMSSLGDSATALAGNRGMDPRRLVNSLAGDIDCIVLKALEKDRNRRYSTPENFGEDVLRYLRREAILARPASTAYKVRKFVQRNVAAVATTAAVSVALLIGICVVTWQIFAVIKANALAEQQRKLTQIHVIQQDQTARAMHFQIRRTEKLEQEATDWSNQWVARVAQDPRLRGPEMHAVREDLLLNLREFWNRWIAVDSSADGTAVGGDIFLNVPASRVRINPGKAVGNSDFYRRQSIVVLAYAKHEQAAQEAKDLWNETSEPRGDLAYDLARVYGVCVQAVEDDSRLVEEYAGSAQKLLEKAAEMGYFADTAGLMSEPVFAPLRSREDFRALVKDVEDRRK